MIPKNYKVFKDNIADEVGVNQSVVDDLISFYYSKIRNSLSNIDDLNIYIDNLGTLSIRKARLEKAIIKIKVIWVTCIIIHIMVMIRQSIQKIKSKNLKKF